MRPLCTSITIATVLTLTTGCDRMGPYERELAAVRADEAAGAPPLPARREILKEESGDSFETIAAGLAGQPPAPASPPSILVAPVEAISAPPPSP
jgi:hypothetical protein